MKVLIVFNHPAPYKVDLFNELTKYVDLDVLFERKSAKNRSISFYKNDSYLFNSIKVKSFDINIGDENIVSLKVKKYIKKHNKEYDLIVMNGYSTFAEMSAIDYMKKHSIPFMLLINGGIINQKESKLKRKIKTHYISSASWYMSPSKFSNEYLEYYGASKDKIYNYPYSSLKNSDVLNDLPSEHDKKELRSFFKLPEEKIFVCPSQFIERKNNLSLIELFKEREETLLLIGNGPEKEKYLSYIKENNMKNVIIKDFVPRDVLMKIMMSCDCLVSLSKNDIYGHTILEGMAAGLPVIATKNIVSAKEMIENCVEGYVLNTDHELIIAMEKIDKKMGINSLEKVRGYTIENSAKKFDEIFKELVK